MATFQYGQQNNPYQTNQSFQQPRVAASSAVSPRPPQNAFMQGLGNIWGGITNSVGGALNKFINTPTGGAGTNSIAQNAQQIGGFLNNARTSLQQGTNPIGKQEQLAQQAQSVNQPSNSNVALAQTNPQNINNTTTGGAMTPAQLAQQAENAKLIAAGGHINPDGSVTPATPLNQNNQTQAPQNLPYNTSNPVGAGSNPTGNTGGSMGATDTGGNNTTSTPPPTNNDGNTSAQNNYINSLGGAGNLREQIVQSLANQWNNPNVQGAYNTVGNLESGLQAGNNAIMTKPIPLEFQQGQMAALERDYGPQLTAAKNILGEAITGQQQNIAGLTAAGNLAAGVQIPYSNQFINPLTGTPIGGGATGGSLNDAVSNIIPKLTSGQMTYNDALSALSGYGQGGINALQKALPQGFNIAQSNTLTAQQGSIGPALQYAQATLQNLKNAMGNLQVWGQGSNIPIIGGFANWISNETGIGKQQTSTKNGALAEARQAIQSVLASVKGGTPSEYTGQSYSMLPDNATPADIDAALNNLNTLGATKQGIYGNPGQAGTNTTEYMFGNFNG